MVLILFKLNYALLKKKNDLRKLSRPKKEQIKKKRKKNSFENRYEDRLTQ